MAFVLLLLAAWFAVNAGVLVAAVGLDRARSARSGDVSAPRAGTGVVVPFAGR